MRCPSCNNDNPADAVFCEGCGTKLELICPACKASVSPGARFCKKCGTAVDPTRAASSTTVASPTAVSPKAQITVAADGAASEAIEGERKTVTALFADIKGSMDLMEDLDPEEARAIVDPALKLMIDAAHRYDGYVVQSTGDGIFALFGAPVAHEDHPQRALYAALRMQDEVKRYAEKLRAEQGVNLQVRVGVNTGEVVVRSIRTGAGQTEYTPIGHSTSFASRLQTLANPGSVAISETVRKLVEGYFLLTPLGPARIKGVSEPVNVYEVTGLGPLRTRLQRSAGRGLTKFVGREREMEALRHAAEQAQAGRGQIVAAMAEAGTGKSRLFFEFKATSRSGWMVLETFSVSHGKASAYLPVLDLLQGYFKIVGEDDPRTRREKVAGRIAILDRSLEDTLPYLFSLLGIVEGDDPLARMDGEIKKRRTLEAIKRIVLRESLNQPLMMIFEDLHWIDEETQALLMLLADSIGTAKILLLVNYRPEYSHQWSSKTYHTQLRLDPLGKESAEEMLSALIGDAADLLPLKRLIIERTAANPFFMEEIVQSLFEDGVLQRNGGVKLAKGMSAVKVPATVQAILAARIDRLPLDEKDLLQMMAVLGRQSPLGLIRGVTRRSNEELDRILAALQLGEFIYEQPASGDIEYTFKHALTLEVAYGSLLVERRKDLHERTAREIEVLFSSRLEDHYGDLAHHYTRSGNRLKTLEYLRLSAQQALRRSASSEAISQLTNALRILESLPETRERDQQELILQTMLGPVLIATKGNAASEVGEAYQRAVELGRKEGDSAQLFPVLFGMRSFHLVRAELQQARELGEQLIGLSETTGDPGLALEANLAKGNTSFLFGDFPSALQCLERGFALYDPQKYRAHAFVYGLDPGVFCLCRIAWIFALTGRRDQASQKILETFALAHRQDHAYSLAVAILHACNVHILRCEWSAVRHQAEAGIALCNEQGFANILEQSRNFRAYALAQQGETEEGISAIREGLASYRATRSALNYPYFLANLAEACKRAERFEEGLAAAEEAIALVEKTGERYHEAKLYQIKGELTLKQPSINSLQSSVHMRAEDCFRKSIEIARGQQARTFELDATTALARLLASQGRRDEARTMLADIYNWFTEGFDTADLKDAKALLDRLDSES
jgi:predicted ATPase/class 3 adenylate cyclase